MKTKLWTHRRLFLYTLLLGSLVTFTINFRPLISNVINTLSEETGNSSCFQRQSINHQQLKLHNCLPYERIISSVWTHDGTGIMKYIQWIATRKLGNIKISRLNDECEITRENDFSSNSKTDRFVQVYIVSLSSKFDNKSKCLTDLVRIIKFGVKKKNQIYFKRKSVKATIAYQHLHVMRYNRNTVFDFNISLNAAIEKANIITERLTSYFESTSIINSEDMIHPNLPECEKTLTDFISLLGFNTSAEIVQDVVQYDSHQFTQDATWWDQSETIEYILSNVSKQRPDTLTYSNDFYHLHGNRPFARYVWDNRQCFNDGIFPQMQSESIADRTSTDKPERCSRKKFDCAFSDLYSFNDREKLYQPYAENNYFNPNSIKCGFAVQSILDKVRNRYARNHTCETIVYTCLSNCYDPLPTITEDLPPGVCFVALLDTKTLKALSQQHFQGARTRKFDGILLI